jgi:transcriptional regulator with XRE-family HTH domain
MTHPVDSRNRCGYLVPVTERQARDEGAKQTALIMAAVKQLRIARGWSAQQLADEMTKAGVPWNADVVVNLEHGRRKSLRVHELLALAYVLDMESPLDVLVPYVSALFPVTPDVDAGTVDVRRWFYQETGPLRQFLAASPEERAQLEHDRAVKQWKDALADAGMRGLIPLPKGGGDGED